MYGITVELCSDDTLVALEPIVRLDWPRTQSSRDATSQLSHDRDIRVNSVSLVTPFRVILLFSTCTRNKSFPLEQVSYRATRRPLPPSAILLSPPSSPQLPDSATCSLMARTKQPSPMRRVPSDTHKQANGTHHSLNGVIETLEHEVEKAAELHAREPMEQKQAGMLALAVCVGGIYASL